MLLAKVQVFSDENDFRNHQGIDQRSAIVEIRDVKLVQQEHSVCRNGAKEKGQKQENLRKLLKLVGDLPLQSGALGILAIHQFPFQTLLFLDSLTRLCSASPK